MALPTVYQGVDNPIGWTLERDGSTVSGDTTITDVVVTIEGPGGRRHYSYQQDSGVVSLEDGHLELRLGREGLALGSYTVQVTVYDESHPNGIAWGTDMFRVAKWSDVNNR